MKLKKCHFLQAETNYLGFVINQNGIKPDPKKVEAIQSISPPTTVREVRGFIGMCSYYRRFIPNFSGIAEPIISLTKKYAKFKWSDKCQTAFEFLKNSLTLIPHLVYPDVNKPYTLYTDASDTCIGACLTQPADGEEEVIPGIRNEKPTYYLSHKLSDTQRRWSTIEKEAFAIPGHLREWVVKQYHDDNGHMGIDKTFDTIRQKYYWPNLYKMLYEYVTICVTCQERSMKKIIHPYRRKTFLHILLPKLD